MTPGASRPRVARGRRPSPKAKPADPSTPSWPSCGVQGGRLHRRETDEQPPTVVAPGNGGHARRGVAAVRALTNGGPEGDREKVGFFACMTKVLMGPLLYTAAINGRSMADVVRWVVTRDHPKEGIPGEVASLLEAELASSEPLQRSRAAGALADLRVIWDWDADERMKESCMSRPRPCCELGSDGGGDRRVGCAGGFSPSDWRLWAPSPGWCTCSCGWENGTLSGLDSGLIAGERRLTAPDNMVAMSDHARCSVGTRRARCRSLR